ncbi:MAG: aminotransferase class V-fold PLP-dependent enzyme [Zestosphaera sp.]
MLNGVRDSFPAISRFKAYLNTASVGLMPSSVRRLLNDLLDAAAQESGVEELLEDYVARGRRELARLVGAEPREIAFTVQTTEGLKSLLRSLRLGNGDAVVGFDLDFPTITSILESLCRVRGCGIRIVGGGGVHRAEDLRRVMDGSVRAVVMSSVQWVSGWRMNLREAADIAHEHGALLIVDGVQHVGALRVDVRKDGVDALCVGGEKWMLNPYVGSGFMYVRAELLEDLDPYPYGILNREEPEGGWGSYWPDPDKNVWALPPVSKHALKFEWGGGKPYMLIAALYEAARFINNVGIESIEEHVMSLKKYLHDALLGEGYEIYGYSEDRRHWSGITLVKTGLSKREEREAVRALGGKGVAVSHRGASGISGIRVSTHLYNTKEDVDTLLEELKKLKHAS